MVSQLFVGEGLEGSAILGLGTSVVGLGALVASLATSTGDLGTSSRLGQLHFASIVSDQLLHGSLQKAWGKIPFCEN